MSAKSTEVPYIGCLAGFPVLCNRQRNSAFLTLCMLSNSSCFYKLTLFEENLPEILSECQTVWVQFRTSVLIWVQTIFEDFQLMTKFASRQERFNLTVLLGLVYFNSY